MDECVNPTKRFLLPSWRPRRQDVCVLGCCDHRHFYLQTGDLLSAFPLRREQHSPPRRGSSCSPPLGPRTNMQLKTKAFSCLFSSKGQQKQGKGLIVPVITRCMSSHRSSTSEKKQPNKTGFHLCSRKETAQPVGPKRWNADKKWIKQGWIKKRGREEG